MSEHGGALLLQFILLELRVAIWPNGHRMSTRNEMYPVIIVLRRRQTSRLGEEVVVVVEEQRQEIRLDSANAMEATGGR